ncbi:restriction endonuclease subunit S domain-containing protein [Furfurilactobacillus curtus]|uniref:restriction endonuclease subunit S n=1 Tax=Furfurilactobacillus curtus TaxID=1746200 RepID=UPI0038B24C1E
MPNLEYEDINSGSGTLNKDITKKHDVRRGIKFEANDVVFGKLRPYLKNWLLADFSGVALGDFWVMKPTSIATAAFVYCILQTESFFKSSNHSVGTKMPRSDWHTVAKSEYFVPVLSEQKLISNFFQKLDSLIAANQRKFKNKGPPIKNFHLKLR